MRVQPIKSCHVCGDDLPVVRWRDAIRRRQCAKCQRAAAIIKARAKSADLRRIKKVPCPCCQREMPANRRTCSRACWAHERKLRLRCPRPCQVCGVEFFPGGRQPVKFCSQKCYCAYIKQRAGEAILRITCPNCGKQFRRHKSQLRGKIAICGSQCREYFSGKNSAVWRGGSDPNRGAGWVKLAESIRLRDGHCCRRCGKTQEANRQRLSVDHIRPWREFDDAAEANQPGNLVSLCRVCHSVKTHVYERKWLKGDGLALQKYRREIET